MVRSPVNYCTTSFAWNLDSYAICIKDPKCIEKTAFSDISKNTIRYVESPELLYNINAWEENECNHAYKARLFEQ